MAGAGRSDQGPEASREGCPPEKWNEGAPLWFLCVPTVVAAAAAPFLLVTCSSPLSSPCPRLRVMLQSLGLGVGAGGKPESKLWDCVSQSVAVRCTFPRIPGLTV